MTNPVINVLKKSLFRINLVEARRQQRWLSIAQDAFHGSFDGLMLSTKIHLVLMTLTVKENNLKRGGKISFIKSNSQIMQVHLKCYEVLQSYKSNEIDVAN